MEYLTITDIMVGDIIRYADQEKPQKATIDTLHAIKEGAKVVGVPFSPENLEKNQITLVDKKKDGRTVFRKKNNEGEQNAYSIQVEMLDGNYHFQISTPIAELNLRFQHYFHELQHALRLVELGDIEKQFKP